METPQTFTAIYRHTCWGPLQQLLLYATECLPPLSSRCLPFLSPHLLPCSLQLSPSHRHLQRTVVERVTPI